MANDRGQKKTRRKIEETIVYLVALRVPWHISDWVKKYRSLAETETAQDRAVRFASNFLQDDDLADELESLSPEEYAARKGIVITNPVERRHNMENGATKQDLEDCIEEASKILEDAYQPENDRETLATAIGDALAALEGDMGEEEADEEGGDDDSY